MSDEFDLVAQASTQPLKNPRFQHISRSAAKRESVQLLGSIKDLQLRFSQAGLEHRAGSGVGAKGLDQVGEDEEEENRPPGSGLLADARRKERRPWKDVELPRVDVEAARREVRRLVGDVRGVWGLALTGSPSTPLRSPTASTHGETIEVLVNTAKSIRRIRLLALTVSHQFHPRRVSTPTLHPPKPYRGRTSISTPSRPGAALPRAVSYGTTERKSSLAPVEDANVKVDLLGDLRKAAIEVLTGLRGLEECLRLDAGGGTPSQSGITVPSEVGSRPSSSLGISRRPGSAFSGSIYTETDEYYDEDAEYSLNALAEGSAIDDRPVETWEERIVSEGRQYRDLEEDRERERAVRESVKKWIGRVERLFVVGEMSFVELEGWVRNDWAGRDMERLHAFLSSHLPLELQLVLPPPTSSDLLSRLSDGYMLIQAFNTALTRSTKPWGFIPEEDIHDTLAPSAPGATTPTMGEEGKKVEKEWTFRRVGNLTCWAAAVKLRYQLPLHMPTTTTSSTFLPVPPILPPKSGSGSRTPSPRTSPHLDEKSLPTIPFPSLRQAPRIEFDPLIVAKRSEGWEEMLKGVVMRWVECVGREARDEQNGSVNSEAEVEKSI